MDFKILLFNENNELLDTSFISRKNGFNLFYLRSFLYGKLRIQKELDINDMRLRILQDKLASCHHFTIEVYSENECIRVFENLSKSDLHVKYGLEIITITRKNVNSIEGTDGADIGWFT